MHSMIHNPIVPACIAITEGTLNPGTRIFINGRCNSDIHYGRIDSFQIDFFDGQCEHLAPTRNILFHFNPRFNGPNHGTIAMNSFRNGYWEQHVEHGYRFPFCSAQTFRIEFRIENDCFRVWVDDQYICEFKHRYDYRNAKRMHINGRLTIDSVRFECKGYSYGPSIRSRPSRSYASAPIQISYPSVPFYHFDKKLSRQPYDIFIAGIIHTNPNEYFQIDLANSEGNRYYNGNGLNKIPIHFSIRPWKGEIVRNTMTNGVWGTEEKYLNSPFSLLPGNRLDMIIRVDYNGATVAINGQSSFEYRHRQPPHLIDAIRITGSVRLEHVRF